MGEPFVDFGIWVIHEPEASETQWAGEGGTDEGRCTQRCLYL